MNGRINLKRTRLIDYTYPLHLNAADKTPRLSIIQLHIIMTARTENQIAKL